MRNGRISAHHRSPADTFRPDCHVDTFRPAVKTSGASLKPRATDTFRPAGHVGPAYRWRVTLIHTTLVRKMLLCLKIRHTTENISSARKIKTALILQLH